MRDVKTGEGSKSDIVVLETAQRAGYAAMLDGKGFTANPRRISTHRLEAQAWARGWAAARTDLKRENAKLR